jgi:hypothetical protein
MGYEARLPETELTNDIKSKGQKQTGFRKAGPIKDIAEPVRNTKK